MTRLLALRTIVWIAPIAFAYLVVASRRKSQPLIAGILMGLLWNGWALLAVNMVAVKLGWWSFHPGVPSFMGVAIEPWLGWTVLWAAAPLVETRRPVAIVLIAVAWLDLIAMPALTPLVILEKEWLAGEAVSLVAVFLPGALLVRWTIQRSHLYARLALQVVTTAALFLWLIPTAALESSGGWNRVFGLPTWQLGALVQSVLLLSIPAVRAAIEFADKGRGTPLPYDPPAEIVTSGPYAYVRNPMQLSMVLVFVSIGIVLWNPWLIGAALVSFAYGAGLAEWHEDVQLSERFGRSWTEYRAAVRSWVPRVRPSIPEEATLLVAFSCGTCSEIGRWFQARHPVGLTIAPAEESGDPALRRVTYIPARGEPKRGVNAIARALEHIHIGWAVVGWVLAVPAISHFAQLVADVFGPAPQNVAGRGYDAAACDIGPVKAHRSRRPPRRRSLAS